MLTSLATHHLAERNDHQVRNALRTAAEDARTQILERMQTYEYSLTGMRDVVLTAGDNLSRELITRYGLIHDLSREFKGARGVGFIRRVPLAEEQRFVQDARADGYPDSPSAASPSTTGIASIEPIGRNQLAVGLDAASELSRRDVVLLAMRSGKVQLSAPLYLQALSRPEPGLLMVLPVYLGGHVPDDLAQHEAATQGWSYVPLSIQEMLGTLQFNTLGLRVELSDVTDPAQPRPFYRYHKGTEQDERPDAMPLPEVSTEQDVYGRQWRLNFTATPAFVSALELTSLSLVHLFGKLFSQGNLDALDLIATLPARCCAEAQVRCDLLRAQIETLDFAAALTILPDLKEAL